MQELYRLFVLLMEEYASKHSVELPTLLYRSLGIFVPIVVLAYALFSYKVVFSPSSWVRAHSFALKFALIAFTAVVILYQLFILLLICL